MALRIAAVEFVDDIVVEVYVKWAGWVKGVEVAVSAQVAVTVYEPVIQLLPTPGVTVREKSPVVPSTVATPG
jgi:hypothetical protein